LYVRDGYAAAVDHVDAHGRHAPGHRNESVLDCPRTDTGKQVAAVLAVTDLGLVDGDLQEQVVDVRIGALRAADDRDLAGERMRASDAVDLPFIRRAHRREQHAIAQRWVGRQVPGVEVQTLRCARAHEGAGDARQHEGVPWMRGHAGPAPLSPGREHDGA
jgi:hypothetical protein